MKKMQINILPINEAHIEGFHAALDVVAKEKKYLSWCEAPPIESTRKFVLSNIKNGIPQFVAVVDDKVVGWCDCSPIDRPVFSHRGVIGMGILPEYRGQGIGKQLLLATIKSAQKIGLERIELGVFASNKNAIGLYERLGFRMEGTKHRAAKFGDHYEDEHLMALIFKDQ